MNQEFEVEVINETISRLEAERDGWKETAAMFGRNADFYKGLIERCGKAIGKRAYTDDCGCVGESVLALRVPEIIEEMFGPKNEVGASVSPVKKPGLLTRIRYAFAIIFKG